MERTARSMRSGRLWFGRCGTCAAEQFKFYRCTRWSGHRGGGSALCPAPVFQGLAGGTHFAKVMPIWLT
jgi:hypothetical protein